MEKQDVLVFLACGRYLPIEQNGYSLIDVVEYLFCELERVKKELEVMKNA